MGHDHHFLSRLDRVHAQHTELALSLYRDDELIRRILAMAEVPEAAERVAISLDDERRGPFIIVARNGHFVTCLGEGMGVKDAHTVTRARLDEISQYIGVLRERMHQAKLLTGGETELLLDSLGELGDAMSRERFRALLSLTEMLRPLADRLMEGLDLLYTARTFATRHNKSDDAALHELWRLAWFCAHMHLIIGSEWEPGSPDPLTALWPRARVALSWCAVQTGWLPMTIRGLRTIALAGSSVLDELRSLWELGQSKCEVLHALFSMIAIAARDRSTAGDIHSILLKPPGPRSPKADGWRVVHELLWDPIRRVIESPEEARARIVECGRTRVVRDGQHLPVGAVARYILPSQIPEQLALARIAATSCAVLDLMDGGARAAVEVAACAGMTEPEDFYPDQDYLASLRPQWRPERTREMVRDICKSMGKRARSEATTPSQKPNEPCACGSGKKFKRCCGSVVTH